MQKRLYFLVLVIVVALSFGEAQQLIIGTVQDRDTQLTISNCQVQAIKSKRFVTSDNVGRFSIAIKENDLLIFSMPGYKLDSLSVDSTTSNYVVLLTPNHTLLDEVVVTAITHASHIKETPISVTLITKQEIDRTIENNIIDVLSKNTPGLATLKTGPNISKPFIRGLGFNRVLTLYDGVRQEGQQWGGEHGLEVDNYNIDRAEVIKGPASLVYGSDAMAGVVSLMPFTPRESDCKIKGRWLSEYQHNNGLVGNGFRVSSANTHWLWVARGALRVARNFINKVDGRVYNTGFQEKNLSALVGYKPASGFTHLNVSLYDNSQGIPDGSRDSLTRSFTKQVFEGDHDNIADRPIVSSDELDSYRLSPLHQRIQHYRLYANNHNHLGKGDVNFLIAFSQNRRREFNHPTATEQAGTYLRLNTINYNLRYNAPEINKMEISLGANGMFQNNKNLDASNFPIPDYNLKDLGLFAVATWKANRWTLTGGARFDRRTIETKKLYSTIDPSTGFSKQVFSPNNIGADLQFDAINESFGGISFSLGSTYKINETFDCKVNFSRGYRAPSISEIAANGLDAGAHIIYIGNPDFSPEFSWQQDIGLFAEFSGLSFSASLFNKNIQNYIYLNQVTNELGQPETDAQGNKTFQYQQASAQLYGAEIISSWQPKEVKGLIISSQFAFCYGFNRSSLYKNRRTLGEYLPFIPPAHGLLSIRKEFSLKSPFLSSINITTELDVTASQQRFLELYQTETQTPGYSLINIAAGVMTHKKKESSWQFQIQVNNLFDIAYQSNLSRLKYFEYYQQSTTGYSGIYNMGRNACVKIIYSF